MKDHLNTTVFKINFNFLFTEAMPDFGEKFQILTWITDFCMSYVILKICLIKSNQNTDSEQFFM